MILYVDGDSYTTPNFLVRSHSSYWSKFGEYVNAPQVINYAYTGKSNRGMFRNATRFCLEHCDDDIFVLIGLSHLERHDYYDSTQPTHTFSKNPNPKEHGVVTMPLHHIPDLVKVYDRELEESEFLSSLINFYEFLKSRKNIKFMIHFCSKPLVASDIPLLDTFYKKVQTCPEIVNLFDNTYTSLSEKHQIKPIDFDTHGWFGHQGSEGNELYANLLINYYKQLYEN